MSLNTSKAGNASAFSTYVPNKTYFKYFKLDFSFHYMEQMWINCYCE